MAGGPHGGAKGYINLGHGRDLEGDVGEAALRARCERVLDAAWASGVRHFDVARSYGLSEDFLAGWLASRGVAPGEVVVTSKWGYSYTAGWRVDTGGAPHEVKEHTATNAVRQAAETGALLGAHVRLYQVHSATLESGFLDGDVIEALERVRAERGWRIGLTLSGTAQADTLREALRRAPEGLFSCVQATYNVCEQSVATALQEAADSGVSVIIKEVRCVHTRSFCIAARAGARHALASHALPPLDLTDRMACVDVHGVRTRRWPTGARCAASTSSRARRRWASRRTPWRSPWRWRCRAHRWCSPVPRRRSTPVPTRAQARRWACYATRGPASCVPCLKAAAWNPRCTGRSARRCSGTKQAVPPLI